LVTQQLVGLYLIEQHLFSGDGSTVAFTLEQVVAQDEDVLVSVDGVVQEPSVAYAVSSGTTLTFTAAPSNNAGNNIFVYYLASQAGTIGHPSTQGLTATTGTFTGDVTIGDASAADKKIVFDGNAQDFHIGLDDSADSLIIGKGSALGTTTSMAINADGIITKPLQPAFLAVPASGQTDLATNTTIAFGTEKFDQNADFASNTFTAPVTGKYQLNFMGRVDQIDTAANWQRLVLVTSNTTYESQIIDLGGLSGDPNYWNFNINVLADMDASDTAFIKWQHDGGSNVADMTEQAFFSGYLVA
jgi:hypothetical protein